MTVYRVTLKQAFNRYMLLSLFPGCFCSASLQPFFIESKGGSLLLGLVTMPVPFVVLATYLVSRTLSVALKADAQKSLFPILLMLMVGIMAAVLAVARISPAYSDYVTGKMEYIGEYPEASHILMIWLGGHLSGWAAMLYMIVKSQK